MDKEIKIKYLTAFSAGDEWRRRKGVAVLSSAVISNPGWRNVIFLKNKFSLFEMASGLDSACSEKKLINSPDIKKVRKIREDHCSHKLKSTLFRRGQKTNHFFTEDSKLYITPKEYETAMKKGAVLDRKIRKWDSISSRIVRNYAKYTVSRKSILCRKLLNKYEDINSELMIQSKNLISRFSMVRVWNFSIIAAILLGMFMMTMIYRYLGQGASARDAAGDLVVQGGESAVVSLLSEAPQALRDETASSGQAGEIQKGSGNVEYIEQVIQDLESSEKEALEKKMIEMVKDHPIEKMIPYIVEKDRIVAAFLIGIAKKESNWGERVPVLDGQDCYNYWGYRGQRRLMGTGGHTCFNSRKDAVDTVAKRIEWLVDNNKLNTPEKMIIWKCGTSCAGHSNYSVQKWISDVNMYFKKLNN